MAGIHPVFLLFDEPSIWTLLDLEFHLANLILWGGVWTLTHDLILRSMWTSLSEDTGGGNISNPSW